MQRRGATIKAWRRQDTQKHQAWKATAERARKVPTTELTQVQVAIGHTPEHPDQEVILIEEEEGDVVRWTEHRRQAKQEERRKRKQQPRIEPKTDDGEDILGRG